MSSLSNEKKKAPLKHKWTPEEETILLNIINFGEKGALRKVLISKRTNIMMSRFEAWERVM